MELDSCEILFGIWSERDGIWGAGRRWGRAAGEAPTRCCVGAHAGRPLAQTTSLGIKHIKLHSPEWMGILILTW